MSARAAWAIVIGGSAGALTPLREIVSSLPSELPAACFVVIHTSASGGIHLPTVISRWTKWSVTGVGPPEPVLAGHLYVAQANHHLRVTPGGVQGTREPREHHVRPAVDVLFRSAARVYGPRTIAVVISGYGGDGAAGAITVRARRGTVIVQTPEEADVPNMPARTLATATVDRVAPAAEIASIIQDTIRGAEVAAAGGGGMAEEDEVRAIIAEDIREQKRGARNRQTTVVSCPDCGGVMWQTDIGEFIDFSCHIGHRYAFDTLLVQKTEELEAALVTALRLLKEKAILLRQTASRARGNGQTQAAERLDEQASVDERYAEVLQRDLLEAEPNALSDAAVDEEVARADGKDVRPPEQ